MPVGEVEEDTTVSFKIESPKTYADIVKTPLTKNSKNHNSVTWKDSELDRSRTRRRSTSVFRSTLVFTGKQLVSNST